MVRCDILDVIDKLLRVFRNRIEEPFGGIQVVLIGDILQLPPVINNDVGDILFKFYESPFYFFNAKVLTEHKPIYIELKKMYRQHESEFIDLLNAVRVGQISEEQLSRLNIKYNPRFTPVRPDRYVTLVTSNRQVDEVNSKKLKELNKPSHIFEAEMKGIFTDFPTNETLTLKEGAQIMFVKNDDWKRFYNGKMATILKIQDETIEVILEDETEPIEIERETWENIRYAWDEGERRIKEEIIGTFIQFPIRLAWAITIHKSQGLTFEKVIADVANAKGYGQTYVALSRCRTFNGLVLKSKLDKTSIKADPAVILFAQNATPESILKHEIDLGIEACKQKRIKDSHKLGEILYLEHYEALVADDKKRRKDSLTTEEDWD